MLQKQEIDALFVDGNGDDKFVEVAGDTMTGQLTLPGGGTGSQALDPETAATKVAGAAHAQPPENNC